MLQFHSGNRVRHAASGRVLTVNGQVGGKWRMFDGDLFLGTISREKLSQMVDGGLYEIADSVRIHRERRVFSVLGA